MFNPHYDSFICVYYEPSEARGENDAFWLLNVLNYKRTDGKQIKSCLIIFLMLFSAINSNKNHSAPVFTKQYLELQSRFDDL